MKFFAIANSITAALFASTIFGLANAFSTPGPSRIARTILDSDPVQSIVESDTAKDILESNARVKLVANLASILLRQGDPRIFDDVHLPGFLTPEERISNFFQFQSRTNIDVSLYTLTKYLQIPAPTILGALDTNVGSVEIEGLPKPLNKTAASEPRDKIFRAIHTKSINRLIRVNIDDPEPCEGYLYFGNQDYTKILPMLCQVNPFWTSGLTVAGDNDEYLELNAYSEEEASDADSKYLTIMRTMSPDLNRNVNIRFNKDMTVNKIVTYASGSPVEVPKEEWNYYASSACYNMVYYDSVIHATIHVLHYLMTTGIFFSTDHDDALAAWAEPYNDNIAIKYLQVAAVLFDSSINFSAKLLTTDDRNFRGTKAVMDPLRDILCEWGSCKTAEDFNKKFLLKDVYATAKNPKTVIEDAGLLTEYFKHANNVQPFADELAEAMKKNDKKAFDFAEKRLTKFMSACGEGVSSIDSISSWVQLMSCTGIVHGSTLSFNRMIAMPEVLRWSDMKSEKFDSDDSKLMGTILGTIQGMTEDRHVFSNKMESGSQWDTTLISEEVQKVLDTYNSASLELKVAYQKEIVERDDFREFGWILTDHCPDGYDGKQHTIATYI